MMNQLRNFKRTPTGQRDACIKKWSGRFLTPTRPVYNRTAYYVIYIYVCGDTFESWENSPVRLPSINRYQLKNKNSSGFLCLFSNIFSDHILFKVLIN